MPPPNAYRDLAYASPFTPTGEKRKPRLQRVRDAHDRTSGTTLPPVAPRVATVRACGGDSAETATAAETAPEWKAGRAPVAAVLARAGTPPSVSRPTRGSGTAPRPGFPARERRTMSGNPAARCGLGTCPPCSASLSSLGASC